jgi:RHS repeat-associated protein
MKIIDGLAIGNRYLWQGREYDPVTKLFYFRARWYDPAVGKWISKDPIGISGGLNLYAFCANNPLNFVDPLGLLEAISAHNFWGDVAVNGFMSGGVGGHAQGVGACIMQTFIDFWGARTLESNASLAGQYAAEGCEGKAAKHGLLAAGQIALSATAAFGGNNAAHPWIRYVGPNSRATFSAAGKVLPGTWVARAPAFGRDFARAADQLQLPNVPNDVIRVQGAWKQFIAGPQRVKGNLRWGAGGGWEYRVGGF